MHGRNTIGVERYNDSKAYPLIPFSHSDTWASCIIFMHNSKHVHTWTSFITCIHNSKCAPQGRLSYIRLRRSQSCGQWLRDPKEQLTRHCASASPTTKPLSQNALAHDRQSASHADRTNDAVTSSLDAVENQGTAKDRRLSQKRALMLCVRQVSIADVIMGVYVREERRRGEDAFGTRRNGAISALYGVGFAC
jgi:hypothetical protein